MFGIPNSFPYEKIKNITLYQVCFGENEIQLHFDNNININIECPIKFKDDINYTDNYTFYAYKLTRLIGKKIIDVYSEASKTLHLIFENDEFCIYDASNDYESFNVVIDGGILII